MQSITIRKSLITNFGGPSCISVVSAELPGPAPHEAQIEVLYAGFSGADINMRNGKYPFQKSAPLTPGYCFVGTIVRKGSKCTHFDLGTTVVALTQYDSQAERINFPEKYLVPVPEGLDVRLAVALVLDWSTAYGMVYRAAKVSQGQRVFIHGVSGAVGYALLVLCRLQGAVIYGTASQRNHDLLRSLGVTPFVYTDKNWISEMKALGGAHAVFDALGFESYDESFSILCENEPSVLVGYGMNLDALSSESPPRSQSFGVTFKLLSHNLNVFSKKSTTFFFVHRDSPHYKPDLAALLDLAKSGKIDVRIKEEWALEDIRKAHESWGKAGSIGSIIIKVKQ
ncbi:chaperonin 10-like protein [Cladochytrium replicatum]|nr:chaperonin 10-like protein [Cladochytrium replicatum]